MKNLDIDDLLREADQKLKSLKKKICRECKKTKRIVQSGFCEDCWKEKYEANLAKKQETKLNNTDGYVRVYDPTGKLVLEHRYLMEQHLGRPLEKHEIVAHLDGNKANNDLANLVICLKAGIPLSSLKCTSCDTVGTVTIVSSIE